MAAVRHMRTAAGAVAVGASKAASAAPLGKTEAVAFIGAVYALAEKAGDGLPPEQAMFLWSVAGTVVGAVLGGLHLKNGGWVQRLMRGLTCALGGLLLAPFAIAKIPRAESTPEWWHAFVASGIAAFLAWILVEEAGPALREWIRGRRKGAKE